MESNETAIKKAKNITNKCVEDIKFVLKMLWDQTLLLALYVQKLHTDPDLRSRLNLIHELDLTSEANKEEFESLLAVLNLIEKGDSIFSCCHLLNERKEQPFQKRLLHKIETSKDFIFSETHLSNPYSYWSMYQINNHFFDIVDILLGYEAWLKEEAFIEYFSRAFKIGNYSYQTSQVTDETIEGYLLKNENELIDLDVKFTAYLLDQLLPRGEYNKFIANGKYLPDILLDILTPLKNKNIINLSRHDQSNKTPTKGIDILNFNVKQNESKLHISIDKLLLDGMLHIGLIDTVLEAIKVRLINPENYYEHSRRNPDPLTDKNKQEIVHQLIQWHKKTASPLFKRLNQIPKLIASILLHDSNQEIPTFINGINNKSKQEQYEIITNFFIKNFNTEEMKPWCNIDHQQMKERFNKTILRTEPNIKRTFIKISQYINDQQQNGKNCGIAYPIANNIPPPLWFKWSIGTKV